MEQKKLALLLFGISKSNHKHFSGKEYLIDYKKSYENYQKYIFNYFKDYTIYVYFTTNLLNEDEKEELCNHYKPIKCNYIENNSNKTIQRNLKLINVIELCLESNIKYDLVLITRFDLLFQKDFKNSNIQLDKFNLVSILEKDFLICDNFYLFPYKYLENFYIIVKKNINLSHHLLKYDIENINGKDFVNYILNNYKCIGSLEFYKIVRTYVKSN